MFGEALALSVDEEGNTRGLTDDQVQTITDAINNKPSPNVIAAVIDTLDVSPAFGPIIAMLRSL